MNQRLLSSFISIIFFSNSIYAQSDVEHHIYRPHNFYRSAGPSGTGSNIDVIYHKIFWRINPDSTKYIKGSVQTNFKTIENNVTSISFDLVSILIIDSVIFRGNILPVLNITRLGNIATINLGITLPINFTDSLIIYYQGIPPAASGIAEGYQKYNSIDAGNFITTLSESFEDKDWWPCKHDIQDKIDSLDITVSVPWGVAGSTSFPLVADTFWVASNGKMTDSSKIGSIRYFTFKNRYPIASYLVFVSVARYKRYYRSMNINGTNTQVVYNLLANNAGNSATAIAMDKIIAVVDTFSRKFGDYPFKKEKHGYYNGFAGGGMEHQTFSGVNSSNPNLLVHEMMHQWFGNNVTFAHWNDLWLAEGFAEYSSQLAEELVPAIGSPSSAFTSRNSLKNIALSNKTQSAWLSNSNTQSTQLIFSTDPAYKRGAMVVSMLRTMCGDSIYFAIMTKYQTELAGKSATADTLKNYFNRALRKDISVFFNDYVGGSGLGTSAVGGIGNPINTINWNNPGGGKRLVISMSNQLKTTGSNVTYFRGPIQLHIKGVLATNDTTITFFDWGTGNLSYAGNALSIPISGNRLTYDLSFVPTTLLYDDSARTLSTGSTIKISNLDGYVWHGTNNSDWNDATNWQSNPGLPPSGADVTISTIGGINQPLLPIGNTIVGPLTINGTNSIIMGSNTLTLNNAVKSTGTFTGSPAANLIILDQAGTINFSQSSTANHSLNTLSLNSKASATIGTSLLDIFGSLTLPTSATLNIQSANLFIH
jgi:Peptidase family M1 domain